MSLYILGQRQRAWATTHDLSENWVGAVIGGSVKYRMMVIDVYYGLTRKTPENTVGSGDTWNGLFSTINKLVDDALDGSNRVELHIFSTKEEMEVWYNGEELPDQPLKRKADL